MNSLRTNTESLAALLARDDSWPLPPLRESRADYADRAATLLQQTNAEGFHLALSQSEYGLTGCGTARLLDWDTAFFGHVCATLDNISVTGDVPGMYKAALDVAGQLLAWCRSRDVSFISTKIPGPNPALCRALEESGFYLADAVAALSRSGSLRPPKTPLGNGFAWSEHPENVASTAAAFRHLFYDGRFHNDPDIPREAADRLWEAAIINQLESDDSRQLFLLDGSKPAGISIVRPIDTDRASLFIFGVAAEYRGHGLGRALLSETLARLRNRYGMIEVETSTYNTAAVRLYRGLGFEQQGIKLSFHWHARGTSL